MFSDRSSGQPPARSLRWQLGFGYAVLALVVTALLTGLAVRTASGITLAAERRQALAAVSGAATAFSEALSSSATTDMSQFARQQSLAVGGRLLWLNDDGTVRLDAFAAAELGGGKLDLPAALADATASAAAVYRAASGLVSCAVAPVTA